MENDLNAIIRNEQDYYLNIANPSLDHAAIQKILDDNGYLLTGQYDYMLHYEKPNKHDTFNVRNRHRRYIEMINL